MSIDDNDDNRGKYLWQGFEADHGGFNTASSVEVALATQDDDDDADTVGVVMVCTYHIQK